MTDTYDDYLDSQKTIYTLDTSHMSIEDFDVPHVHNSETRFKNDDSLPLIPLMQGDEPIANYRLRYQLFQEYWKIQQDSIVDLVDNFNSSNETFDKIYHFLFQEKDSQDASIFSFLKKETRLVTGLLNLGLNVSNHNYLIVEIMENLQEISKNELDIIRIDSISCITLKVAIRIIVKQFYGIIQGTDDTNEDDEEEEEDDEGEGEGEGLASAKKADLDYVIELQSQRKRPVIVIIDDADSFSTAVLVPLLKMLLFFTQKIELKILMGISTPFIVFQEKIPKILIKNLETRVFDIDKSKEMLLNITESVVFDNSNKLLFFHPSLVNYFEELRKSNHLNLLQFINRLKYVFMVHFFQQPLSILMHTDGLQELEKLPKQYFNVLRRLPSVKNHVELLISNTELGYDLDSSSIDERDLFIKTIFQSHESNQGEGLIQLLHKSIDKLNDWKQVLNTILEFLIFTQEYFIIDNKNIIWQNKLELYHLSLGVIGDQFNAEDSLGEDMDGFGYLNKLWKAIEQADLESLTLFLDTVLEDPIWNELVSRIFNEYSPITNDNSKVFLRELKRQLEDIMRNLQFSNIPFNEIFVLDHHELLSTVFNPTIRDVITDSMVNSKSYIFNPIHSSSEHLNPLQFELYKYLQPSLIEIFKLYREATITVNIYDFYTAFKANLDRYKIIPLLIKIVEESSDSYLKITYNNKNSAASNFDELKEDMLSILRSINVNEVKRDGITEREERDRDGGEGDDDDDEAEEEQDEAWDKLTLSWFLQSLVELGLLGFIKDGKAKTESIDKLIWKDL